MSLSHSLWDFRRSYRDGRTPGPTSTQCLCGPSSLPGCQEAFPWADEVEVGAVALSQVSFSPPWPAPGLPSTPSTNCSELMLWQSWPWSFLKFLFRSRATIQATSRLTGRAEEVCCSEGGLGRSVAPLPDSLPRQDPCFPQVLALSILKL